MIDRAMAVEAAALAKQKPMLDAMAQGESDVQRFYKDSVVFITGGSGFMGKQLIEKLFRSCQISKAYILLRSKKGIDAKARLQELMRDSLFDTLREQQPKFSERIIAIEGDSKDMKLGIKEEDWKALSEEVNVVFHMAATTKFNEPIRTATLINVKGTREVLLLGQACKKLRSFVYVSTAFCHATVDLIGGEVEEKFYSGCLPPEVLISMVENLEEDLLNKVTPDLIKGWPNTYSFTKSIAEELVRTTGNGLPICIVRPSIVTSTYREPVPGWLDKSCISGGIGLRITFTLGAAHASLLNPDNKLQIIPCDYVNNAIVVAAKETATYKGKWGMDTKIYTVCSSNRNPTTYAVVMNPWSKQKTSKFPSPKSIYYVSQMSTTNKFVYRILSLFFHDIPANVADFVLLLMGKERRFATWAKKFYNSSCALSYFALNKWDFIDRNLENLYGGLSKQDQAIFNFDVTNIDWNEYIPIIDIGIRKYIFEDGLKDTEYAIKKQKFLRIFHYVFVTLYAYCIWKLMYLIYFIGWRGCKNSLILLQRVFPLFLRRFVRNLPAA